MATTGQHVESSGSGKPPAAGSYVEYEAFIESQLRRTRGHVRAVDFAASVLVLLVGSLAFVLFAALIDHWAVTGGLGFWGRMFLLAAYLLGAGWWTATAVLPLLFKRINPLYAAHTIERSKPSLKNSLVNFLLFRSEPAGVHQRVLEQIEQQAATSLVGVQVESAVDRTRLIRLGYVLIGVLGVCALYALLSPKNLFQTVGRVAMPWADITPPTSTTIDEIEPGTAQAFRGQQVTVKARVQGLPDGGQVRLYYSTADRQIVDRPLEMTRPPDDYRHAAVLPDADGSLQQSLTYRIAAGDATTREYSIQVVAAPTIVVRAVEYKYPGYTGLLAQRIEHQGDLKGIEGTAVTLEALANQPIAQAYVDFDCNNTLDLPMQVDGTQAKVTFKLLLAEGRQAPEHASYQLVFKNESGQQNLQPVRHQIEVTPDQPPVIQFVAPRQQEIEVPLDGALDLEVVASDPDFELAQVTLSLDKSGKPLAAHVLLKENWRGQFNKKHRFIPTEHRLAAGDVVEYFAVATDNKTPRPNKSETARRSIRITSPDGQGRPGDQLARNSAAEDAADRPDSDPSGGDNSQPSRDGETPEAGDPQANEQGTPGEKQDKPAPSDEKIGQQPPDATDDGEPSAERGASEQPEQAGDDNRAAQARQDASQQDQPEQDSQQQDQQAGESGSESGDSSQQSGKSGQQQSGGKQSGQQQKGAQQQGGKSSGQKSQDQAGQGESESSDDASGGASQGSPANESDAEQSSGAQESVASDGSNDGDAIERILEHREQKSPSDKPSDGQKSGAQQKGPSQAGDKPQSGDQQQSGGEQQNAGDQQNAVDQKSAGQPGANQKGSRSKSQSQKSSGEKQPGQDPQPGKNEPSQSDASGESQRGQDAGQQGEKQNGKPSGDNSGKDQTGDNSGESESSGEQKPGDESAPENDSAAGQESQQGDQPRSGQSGSRQSQGKPQQSSGEQGESETGDQQQPAQDGQQSDVNERQRGEGSQDQQQSSQQGGQEKSQPSDPRSGATQDNNTRPDGSPQKPDTQGQGAQSKDDPRQNEQQQAEQSSEQRPDARGGDGEQSKGDSGAGQQSNENAGSPKPQDANKPRDKSQQQGGQSQQQKRDGQEQSPSNSNKESDSQGDEDGDRSGGGKRGGGQKANQAGTGGAGQNTAADEGAGQSEQSGDGETSDRAGDDRQSQSATGESGKQAGQGSQQSPTGDGQQQSGGSSAGDQPSPTGQQPGSSQGGNTQSGERPGAQQPSGSSSSDQQFQPGTDKADAANLEYTRKATDLALEHLKHELEDSSSDPELLKRLGWSRQEAEEFIRRWETLRKSAAAPDARGEAGRRELDDTLRSLGLKPRGAKLSGNAARDDRMQGLKESHRTTPPAEYSEAFKAYTQGTARGGK